MGAELKDDKRMLNVIDNTIIILESANSRTLTDVEKKKIQDQCKAIKKYGIDQIRLQHLINAYQEKLKKQIKKLIRDEITKNMDQDMIEARMVLVNTVAKAGLDQTMSTPLLNSLKELNILVKQHADIVQANERADAIIAKLVKDIRKAE